MSTELNALGQARSQNYWEPPEGRRHIAATFAAWRDDRIRIEESLRHSDDELRTICGVVRGPAFSSSLQKPNAHSQVTSQGVEELVEVPGQIAMLENWQARRNRIAAALRHSDDELLALFKIACQSKSDLTLRIA